MLTLAFDTATGVATSALVRDGEVLGERSGRAAEVLADADELLRAAGLSPRDRLGQGRTDCRSAARRRLDMRPARGR